jgi:hypothetical protein
MAEKKVTTIEFSVNEIRALYLVAGDRLSGEWDETFEGEEQALQEAYSKLKVAQL